MNDLLGDVQGNGRSNGGRFEDIDLEAGTSPRYDSAQTSDKYMDEFFQEVSVIKGQLNKIKLNQQKLLTAHEMSKSITRAEEMKAVREKMQLDINEVNKIAHELKNRLERLQKLNETSLSRKGSEAGTASARTRSSVTAALSKKLKDMMAEFQDLRARLQSEYREVVERRTLIVTGQRPTEQQVEHMIETGESETIFQKAIQEQGRGHIQDTVAEIQERHEAVVGLEKSLMELHQIFLDMAVLVEAQGAMLDNIENQVGTARDHVSSGVTHLTSAKQYQKSTRKWQCALLLVVLCILAAIAIAIAVHFTRK